MKLSITKSELVRYIVQQLNNYFPDNLSVEYTDIYRYIDLVLDRTNICFSAIYNHYFQIDGQVIFNHLHSEQYAMFLYLLGNTLYKDGIDTWLCDKVFYLNKALHGIDALYNVELPDIFMLCHPIGTILGRAKYSNYLLVHQGCTIGAARGEIQEDKNIFPVLGEYCSIYAGASVLGNCHVGDNCKISAHSLLIDQDLESNQIYIGTRLNYVVKSNRTYDNIWGANANGC